MTRFAFLIEPPFNFRSSDGNPTGSDVELARTVLQIAGIDDFEPVETEFSALLSGVADGRWRMTTGLFATDERRGTASFSRPIWALPDGLLVRRGIPLGFTGYRSMARSQNSILAVIRDQFQHRSAMSFGIPEDRILIFETYAEAAQAVLSGKADAYASVAKAHSGFIDQNARDGELEVIFIDSVEKEPAYGSFAFNKSDEGFRKKIDSVLQSYLGSAEHRTMMKRFGFSDTEIDLVL